MNAIQRFFISVERWQLFAFLVGSMCVIEVIVIATYPTGDSIEIPMVPLIAAELWYICFVAWFWSLGSFLNSVVRPELRLSLKFFYLALIYPPVYIAFFQAAFEKLTSPYIFFAVFPFHLFAMYCLFFNLNFVSKSLALAEKGEPVSFYDYAGALFLLWFFPIGIWFVQPRVNRLYANRVLSLSS